MATNKVLFFSVDYLRDNTVIDGNTDGDLLQPFIVMAQNTGIEPILGTKLFNEIVSSITSLSTVNKVLMDDYIHPALLQWSLYQSLPFINYKLTNKAVSTSSSDNSDPIELNEIHYLRTAVKDVAEYYSERMTQFLKANTSDYPLFLENGTSCDEIHPNDENYQCGIVFN